MTTVPSPLTIGVPAYNAAATLPATLDSILAQSYVDFTVLVADNASTDETSDILSDYASRDERVQVIRHEENLGGAANFSCLPGLAESPFFKWQAADDLIGPTMVERGLEVMDHHPDVVLAYGKTVMIGEDGQYWRRHEDNLHLMHDSAAARLSAFVKRQWLCNAQFGVLRREAIVKTSLLQPQPSSDLTMLAQLAMQGKFWEIPQWLFFRRMAADSMGLGDLSDEAKAAWLDPRNLRIEKNPQMRVFLDTNKAIARAQMPVADKARAFLAYDVARSRKAFGKWRYERRVAKGTTTRTTWDDLRDERPAGLVIPGETVRVHPDQVDVRTATTTETTSRSRSL